MDSMAQNLVARAQLPPISVHESGDGELEVDMSLEVVRKLAARLLAQGFKSREVAKALGKRLVPGTGHTDPDAIANRAYHKLRRWIREDQKFRDLIYEQAVVALDLDTPEILKGVGRAAKRGRVDAARFALEITGRHMPNHEAVVTNVTVQVANIPRPEKQ
jgi:hypothetical protein